MGNADGPIMENRSRRAPGVLIQEAGGEVLALHTLADEIHQMNGSAGLIWRLYEEGASVEEITRNLVGQFEVDEATARADAESTIEKLRALNIVV